MKNSALSRDTFAVTDTALYQTTCRSEDEASHLLAILNSRCLESLASQFMPRGQFGARHFQKHGWKLPIPRFDASEPLHVRLSELGAAAERECADIIADSGILEKKPGDAQSRAARRLLRHKWQPESAVAQAIEVAVAQLLADPAQAALAARQMAAAG